jgi:hypothetical protein
MAATKTPIASDSAAELHGLIGDDATATFESDPKFIDSNPTGRASSESIALRDTDDTEDSNEEFAEAEEDEEDEDEEEEEDEDEDDEDADEEEEEDEEKDVDDEDDEEEFGAIVLRTTGSTNVRGPVKSGKTDVEEELEEMDEGDRNGAESIEQDVEEGIDNDEDGSDNPQVDRAIDAALRMSALAAVAAEFAANAYTLE